MTFVISASDQAILNQDAKNAPAAGNWAQFYKDLYAAISVTNTVPVDGGDMFLNYTPSPGVEDGAWLWVQGAISVNSGVGPLGNYIRGYTSTQYRLRTGAALTDDEIKVLIQRASNGIAEAVYNDLVDGGWVMPGLHQLGEHDAASVAAGVFSKGASSTGAPNFSPWAGTVNFVRLGDEKFFLDWVLTNEINQNKQEMGTYDLVSIAQAQVANQTLSLPIQVLFSRQLSTALQTLALGKAAVADATAKANAFFINTYGNVVSSIDIGSAVFDLITDVATDSQRFMVGTLKGQSVIVGPSRQVVVGGPGDDSFTASFLSVGHPVQYAARVLDGGPGNNALTYQTALVPLTATLKKVERSVSTDEAAYQGAPKLTMQVTDHAGSFTDNDYNFQSVTLGASKNTFALGPGLTRTTW